MAKKIAVRVNGNLYEINSPSIGDKLNDFLMNHELLSLVYTMQLKIKADKKNITY